MRKLILIIAGIWSLLLGACTYRQTDWSGLNISAHVKDSLSFLYGHHYTFNANFLVTADSLLLEQFPLKETSCQVYKGDRLVVAEFMIQPADMVDSVWVKVAHNQEIQGWVHERDLLAQTVPADSVSQFIHVFSNKHSLWFVMILTFFLLYLLAWGFRKKQVKLVYFDDIDSIFPMMLCVLIAFSAMLYGTMQHFCPDVWIHYYFNPTLNPFGLPLVLGLFVSSVWLIVVVALAVVDDLFHQVSFSTAFFYMFGLSDVCICCYLFFIFFTSFYIGYFCFPLLLVLFVRHVRKTIGIYSYRCGYCGAKIRGKGECPHCGATNL